MSRRTPQHDVPDEVVGTDTTELSRTDGEPTPYGRLIPAWGTPLIACPTNIDRTTPAGKAALINALGESSLAFDKDGEVEITCVQFLSHPAESTDPETGEVKRHNRLVLIDHNGDTVVTTSDVIPHRLAALLDVYDGEIPAQGVRVKVIERKARRSGRTYHDLRVIPTRSES